MDARRSDSQPLAGVNAREAQGVQVGDHNVQANIFAAPQWRASRPRQLPPMVAHFTGRAAEMGTLTRLLRRHAEAAGTVVISAIGGTAGIGKTALAVYWAHQVAGDFPDGQLYVNLRGFDVAGQVLDPADALRRFLDALGVPTERVPADLDAQAALYRSELADRRMLVVLDNARDTAQVRPLLPGAPGCLVLVTSRNELSGLVAADGARSLTLGLLSRVEARELLAAVMGEDRVAAEPQAVEEIVDRCARLPLALAIVAARATLQPRLPLRALAAELRDGRERLDTLATDDPATDVRTVFSWSYLALSPGAARLFRLLGLHPGPEISTAAAASLAGLPPARVRPLLAELGRANLLAVQDAGRYALHDLLRAYAVDLVHDIEPGEQRRAAVVRMLDHYLHSAFAANRVLAPERDPITPAPSRPGVTLSETGDYAQAMAWFAAEHAVLLSMVDRAVADGFDTHTWQIAWTLATYLDRRAHWHDWADVQRAALAAGERLADPSVQGRAHRVLAAVYKQLRRYDDAHTHLQHALDLSRASGDDLGQANAHLELEEVQDQRGLPAEALTHAELALRLYRAAGHRVGQADALNAIGWLCAEQGDPERGLACCRQALAIFQELDDAHGLANTWDSLGHAHHCLGHHAEAIASYQEAIEVIRRLGDRYEEAATLTRIGEAHHAAGDPAAARHAWQSALRILDELRHPDADTLRTRLATIR